MVGLGLSLSLFLFFCMAVLACLAWGISDADVGSAGMGDDCLRYGQHLGKRSHKRDRDFG